MSVLDPLDEQRAMRVRQRLWGAAVFIALAVIFLPLLLDGSGSESQYRRVERLREEPPRIVDEQGNVERQKVPGSNRGFEAVSGGSVEPVARNKNATVSASPSAPDDQSAGNNDNTDGNAAPAARGASTDGLSAWVVQAGSFKDEQNALAVRDRLRRAGYPSFVTPTDDARSLFRVRVGPMIDIAQARRSRDAVMKLLGREAIVVSYP